MKILPRLAGLAFLVSLNCAVISVASAQSPPPVPAPSPGVPLATDHSPQASITFDDGSSIIVRSREGRFARVTAKINQAATIQLQYPTDLGGQPIILQSLDGAQIIGNTANLTVATDGTATFNVRMGDKEGLYRFALVCGDSHTLLRFYAFAPGDSPSDPTLLIPRSHGGG